jgi:alanyl-tRNA synthetase
MTERLYYSDSYLRAFQARVVDRAEDGRTVYLDRTAFYPASGGQPFDRGTIAGAAVVDVIDEEERIAHRLAEPVEGEVVECSIDWERRFDHMQQHTGQHLLSAVFADRFGLKTVSFHLGADSSTIDLEGAAIDAKTAGEAERLANRIITENRLLSMSFEDAAEAAGLRKTTARQGMLRIVTIEGLDRNACGGTHLRATGEIGVLLLRKTERIRNSTRVEFLCGSRAVRRARMDFDVLMRAAQQFSSPLDDVPALVEAQVEGARTAEKARRKLEMDLAGFRGRELYSATAPGADGLRRVTQRLGGGSLEDVRALAQSFVAQPKAVFVAALAEPPSVLLAVSGDAGIDAGKTLKAALAEAGGRGGGTSSIAQGSVADCAALEQVLAKL